MSTRFTPGPWRYDKSNARRNEYHIHNGKGGVYGHVAHAGVLVVAQVGKLHADCTDNTAEAEANARLIAAAPQMYEALKRMTLLVATIRNLYGSAAAEFIANGEAYKDAVAALALAEGKDEDKSHV